jgi:hypothetical protein
MLSTVKARMWKNSFLVHFLIKWLREQLFAIVNALYMVVVAFHDGWLQSSVMLITKLTFCE